MKNLKSNKCFDVVAEIELTYTVKRPKPYSRYHITKVSEAVEAIRTYYNQRSLQIEHREFFGCCYLNSHGNVLGFYLVSSGNISSTMMSPEIIFQGALRANATTFIMFHNHPSGNVQPTKTDIASTKNLVALGIMHNILVKDHIILTKDYYFSFADESLITY